jgi:hypothetical protein
MSHLNIDAKIKSLVDLNHQYCDVREGWLDFLYYLEKRLGVDLHDFYARDDIRKAMACVNERYADKLLFKDADDAMSKWFTDFSNRSEVIEAFTKFCEYKGFSSAPHQLEQ